MDRLVSGGIRFKVQSLKKKVADLDIDPSKIDKNVDPQLKFKDKQDEYMNQSSQKFNT